MTVEPSFQMHQYWEWIDDDGPYPHHQDELNLPTLTQTGTAIDTPLAGSDVGNNVPNGGEFNYSFDFSPNVQHFIMEATPPNYDPNAGEIEPGITPDTGYTGVDVSLDGYFQDTMTNDSSGSVTLDFTYTLKLLVPLQGQLDTSQCQYQFGTSGGTIDFFNTGGQGTGHATITLAPHQVMDYSLNYDFEGSAYWTWPTEFDQATQQYTLEAAPTQSVLVYEAPDTGHATFDEVDSQGHIIPGNPDVTFASGIDFSSACFAAGTLILTATARGEAPVEALKTGDLVTGKFSGLQPIAWIGHRTVDCSRIPQPHKVWPVCVSAGAFGTDKSGHAMPRRDLWLSPDHAVYADDVLIPVKHLINGSSITQMPVDKVTYYHVELPQHDVLRAEGLPAESYLDTGNRSTFMNAGPLIQLHPDFASWAREAEGCAPLVVTGPRLQAVQEWVNALADVKARSISDQERTAAYLATMER